MLDVDTRTRTQCLDPRLQFRSRVSLLAASEGRRTLIVVEEGTGKVPGQINVLMGDRDRKSFMLPCRKNIAAVAVSESGKWVIAASVAPTNQIVVYKVDTEQVLMYKDTEYLISQVSFSPVDDTVIILSGYNCMKYFVRRGIKLEEFSLLESAVEFQFNFLQHSWVNNKLISCTDDGAIFVFENFKYVQRFNSPCMDQAIQRVQMLQFRNGLLLGIGESIYLYDENFVLLQNIALDSKLIAMDKICDRDSLITLHENGRMASLSLGMTYAEELEYTERTENIIGFGAHNGPIGGLSMCTQGSLSVSFNSLNLILWDMNKLSCVYMETLNETPLSIALHPSGFHLLISFSHSIFVLSITAKGFVKSHEIFFEDARLLTFSSSGSMFSFVKGPTIYWYDWYSCRKLGEFIDFRTAIKFTRWSNDDRLILMISSDGIVSVFGVWERHQIFEFRVYGINQNAALFFWGTHSQDHQLVLTGSDGILRVISFSYGQDKKVKNDIFKILDDELKPNAQAGLLRFEMKNCELVYELNLDALITHMAFGQQRYLLLFTNTGELKIANWPIKDHLELIYSISLHAGPVTEIAVHPLTGQVVTSGVDGIIVVSNMISEKNHHHLFQGDLSLNLFAIDDVTNLETSNELLEKQLKSTEMRAAENAQITKLFYESRIEELNRVIVALKFKEEQLQAKMADSIGEIREEFGYFQSELRAQSEKEKDEIRFQIQEQTIGHFQEFEAAKKSLKKALDLQMEENEKERRIAAAKLIEVKEEMTQQVQKLEDLLQQEKAKFASQKEQLESSIDFIENDYEDEIKNMNDEIIKKLNTEAVSTAKAISTMSVAVRQFESTKSVISRYKVEVEALKKENCELCQKIEFLQTEVLRAKQYVKHRDLELTLRQKELGVLYEKSFEKDKIQKVVASKIQQMEEQEEPKFQYIQNLLAEIQSLESRNESLTFESRNLAEKENVLNEKVSYMDKKYNDMNQVLRVNKSLLENVMKEIAYIAEVAPLQEYSTEIARLYTKYLNLKMIPPSEYSKAIIKNGQADSVEELARQRDYLTKKTQSFAVQIRNLEKSLQAERIKSAQNMSEVIDDLTDHKFENKRLNALVANLQSKLLGFQYENKIRERGAENLNRKGAFERIKNNLVEHEKEEVSFISSVTFSGEKLKRSKTATLRSSNSSKNLNFSGKLVVQDDIKLVNQLSDQNLVDSLVNQNLEASFEKAYDSNNMSAQINEESVLSPQVQLSIASKKTFSKQESFASIIADEDKNADFQTQKPFEELILSLQKPALSNDLKAAKTLYDIQSAALEDTESTKEQMQQNLEITIDSPKENYDAEEIKAEISHLADGGLENLLSIQHPDDDTEGYMSSPILQGKHVYHTFSPVALNSHVADLERTNDQAEKQLATVRPLKFSTNVKKLASMLSDPLASLPSATPQISKLVEIGPRSFELQRMQEKANPESGVQLNSRAISIAPFSRPALKANLQNATSPEVIRARPMTSTIPFHPLDNYSSKPRLINSASFAELSSPPISSKKQLEKLHQYASTLALSNGRASPVRMRPRSVSSNFSLTPDAHVEGSVTPLQKLLSHSPHMHQKLAFSASPKSNLPTRPLTAVNQQPLHTRFPAMPSTFVKRAR